MNRRNAGFTLIEMLVVIAIFGFVMAGVTQMFVTILRTHRQQSRITESNIEGIIGLELLRQDLGKAGYGLPWNPEPTAAVFTYTEKDTNTYGLNDAPSNAPRGIVNANDVSTGPALINTDVLTIKATNVADNSASHKWIFLLGSGATTSWDSPNENFVTSDRVIVLSPGASNPASARVLRTPGTGALFSNVSSFATDSQETKLVYGIDTSAIRMPFNRADYFVMQPASGMPQRCATGTGVLEKAVLKQGDQSSSAYTYMPLLDCVADMQVVFRLDTDNDGTLESVSSFLTNSSTGNPLTAAETRTQVKEARVYILAQEGQKDLNYTYVFPANAAATCAANHLFVGGEPTFGYSSGRCFDFSGIADAQHYRWKLYTLIVKLDNM